MQNNPPTTPGGESPRSGDLDDLEFGARLQAIRERRGMTRMVLAGLVGRSQAWVKKAERQNVMPDLGMLVRLAKALRLHSVDDLVGPLEIPVGIEVRDSHADAQRITDAIMSWDAPDGRDPVSGSVLLRRAREVSRTWHGHDSPRDATARVLPDLIRDGRHSVRALEGAERRQAAAALVEIYTISEHWLSWLSDRSTMMILVDRGMRAAEDADDPHSIALASWAMGNVLRYIDADSSVELLERAARPLQRAMDDDTIPTDQAAILGSLNLHQAITHAHAGREGDAERHMDAADHIARHSPDGWQHPVTVFAPWNVAIHGVSVQAELSHGAAGARLALDIDPNSVPSPYRRSRLWLDAARAWWADGDRMGAVTALDHAVATSAESTRYSPPAKTLAGALLDSGGAMIAPQARRIARDLGVIA